MSLVVRKSRFRHVYGAPAKESGCFRNLKISKNTHDSNLSDVNQKFLAIATESIGGGSFIVLNLSQSGRVPTDHPCVTGHRAAVTDVKWNPFNPNQIASSSDDGLVRIWNIPEEGLSCNLTKPFAELRNHASRVSYLQWHPLAENIVASVGADKKIIVWNTNAMRPATAFGVFPDITYSIAWNNAGQLLASTSKDRKIRIFDVRAEKVSSECPGHTGMRSSKVCFLRDDQRLLSCGFSKHGSRQIGLWDIRDMSESIAIDMVDHGSGVMLLHYDADLEMVYVVGKGDGNFRYYEILNCEPYFYHLSEYASSQPQRAFCAMPKLGLDFTRNEIARIYKLYATGTTCEPISMIVPRKSEHFQTDIYPDTLDCVPTMTAEEWLNGENRSPKFVSVKELQKNFIASQQVRLTRLKEAGTQNKENEDDTPIMPTMRPQQQQPVFEKPSHTLLSDVETEPRYQPSPPKRNSVLENVKRLEDTIRRFNSGTYVAKQKTVSSLPRREDATPQCSSTLYRIEISIPMHGGGGQERTNDARERCSNTCCPAAALSIWKSERTARLANDHSSLEIGGGRGTTGGAGKVREIMQAFESGTVDTDLRRSKYFSSSRTEFDVIMEKGGESEEPRDNVLYRPGHPYPKIIPVYAAQTSGKPSRSFTEGDSQRKVDLSPGSHFQRNGSTGSVNLSNKEQSYIQKVELAMKKINVGSKGDHSHSQPKPDKAYEQWRNVRELHKKLMSHEERIRQLESKVNAFVANS